mmetsp:Transcript_1756/g.5249  ORF Transcript_1756/g.5249 Transcript_1756/m.5249 type:complete len:433 (-) Transcript_1756:185-1483(-)
MGYSAGAAPADAKQGTAPEPHGAAKKRSLADGHTSRSFEAALPAAPSLLATVSGDETPAPASAPSAAAPSAAAPSAAAQSAAVPSAAAPNAQASGAGLAGRAAPEASDAYRVSDVVRGPWLKGPDVWRLSYMLLAQPRYRSSVLAEFVRNTSYISGEQLSNLPPAAQAALFNIGQEEAAPADPLSRVLRLRGANADWRAEIGGREWRLEGENREALFHSVLLDRLARRQCSAAPPNVTAVHLRIGDKINEGDDGWAMRLLRQVANESCSGNQLVLLGVEHYDTRSMNEFGGAAGVAKSRRFEAALRQTLRSCGVEFSWRSQPDVDEDMCFAISAQRFVASFGGFSFLLLQLSLAQIHGWQWAGVGKRVRGARKNLSHVKYEDMREWYETRAMVELRPDTPGLSSCARTRLRCVEGAREALHRRDWDRLPPPL